ncbi:hypothetical protein EDB86DRAFT_503911 [Lactarius hatsudake]|nr:hypothetical protein EDB86DRAFT_503911 [Lactarius hatsudake]
MTSISTTAASSSCFGQGEGLPSLPHRSVEELTDWFSSELHLFLGTNNVCAPMVVPAQSGDSNGPEPTHVNDHQVHSEGINTFATAVIPFSGRAVPTMVVLSLVPLHLGAGHYTPPLDQGDERPFPLSHLSEPSQLRMAPADDITVGPRYLGRAPPPGGFPIAPRNSIPRPPEVHCDYQPSGDSGITRESIPDGIPAAVTTSLRMGLYPPPFDQVPGVYSDYLVSGNPSASSLVNSGVVTPVHISYQIEGNGLPTSQQLLGQTHQDTPTSSSTAGPIQGVVYHDPTRYQCIICDAKYAWLSGLNRHYKDTHLPRIACDFCGLEFPSGRRYLLTKHLETHHSEV